VTAAFNRNVLHVVNRELDGDFAPDEYAHVALWDDERSRIEMHLEARRPQRVHLRAIDLEVGVAAGERIHTEISAKLTLEGVAAELVAAGFAPAEQMTDAAGDFALTLAGGPRPA